MATTRYVNAATGSNANAGTDITLPKKTIQSAIDASGNGDTIRLAAGTTYTELASLKFGVTGVTLTTYNSGAKPKIDGQGTRGYGILGTNSPGAVIDGLEVTGQLVCGIQITATAYDAAAITVRNVLAHHIGDGRASRSGFIAQQRGIYLLRGVGTTVEDCAVHHIAQGGEAMGIVVEQAVDPVVQRNEVWAIRKEGIRHIYCLRAKVRDNRVYQCWTGINNEWPVGGDCENNIIYDCTEGIWLKHMNDQYRTLPFLGSTIVDFWGQGRIWANCRHNTLYRHRDAHLRYAVGSIPPALNDYTRIKNNLFGGGPIKGSAYLNLDPAKYAPGFHLQIDGNVYATNGVPPRWLEMEKTAYGTGLDLAGLRAAYGHEANGSEQSLAFADPVNGDFSGVFIVGPDLTADGSIFGQQTGADSFRIPGPTATLVTRRPSSASVSGAISPGTSGAAQLMDENGNTYWQSAAAGTAGIGVNASAVLDYGTNVAGNHVYIGNYTHLGTNNAKRVKVESSLDQSSWTNLATTPGFTGFDVDGTGAITLPDNEQSSYKLEMPSDATLRYLRVTVLDTFGATSTIVEDLGVIEITGGTDADSGVLPVIHANFGLIRGLMPAS